MTELTLIQTYFYQYNDWYWLVKGDLLVQFSDNYYLEFEPGNEFYGHMIRRFRKMAPIASSQGRSILNALIQKLNEITI